MCRVRQPAYFDNLESTREGSKTLAQCSIASSKSCHLIIRMMLLFCKRGKVNSLSRVQLFVTPWTLAYQASQSVGFSRQQYWSGLPFPPPGDLPDPGSNLCLCISCISCIVGSPLSCSSCYTLYIFIFFIVWCLSSLTGT